MNLIPTIKDTTGNIEGIDGVTYFGTKYTKRDIPVSFAFEGLTKEQVSLMQMKFSGKEIHSLIFDEHPYKIYSAKVTGQAITKHLAFVRDNTDYFNGEGSITFTCYFPFARSRFSWQEDYNLDNIPEWRGRYLDEQLAENEEWIDEEDVCGGNIYYDFDVEQLVVGRITELDYPFDWVEPESLLIPDTIELDNTLNGRISVFRYAYSRYENYTDWIESSKIPSREDYGKYDTTTHSIKLYNAGDVLMPSRWWFRIDPDDKEKIYNITIRCGDKELRLERLQYLQIPSTTNAGADQWIAVDMLHSLIGGYDKYGRFTGRLYNQFMKGEFFGIPVGEQTIYVEGAMPDPSRKDSIEIYYLYL